MQLAKRNYEIYNKITCNSGNSYKIEAISTKCYGEKFKVWTDHENLKYFKEPHMLNE